MEIEFKKLKIKCRAIKTPPELHLRALLLILLEQPLSLSVHSYVYLRLHRPLYLYRRCHRHHSSLRCLGFPGAGFPFLSSAHLLTLLFYGLRRLIASHFPKPVNPSLSIFRFSFTQHWN